MGRRGILIWSLIVSFSVLSGCGKPAAKRVELFIQTDGDFMSYKPSELSVPAGARVRLTFHHAGVILSQKHDWVLVKPADLQSVDHDGQKAGEDNNWLKPHDPRVIAATPLVPKGHTAVVEFIAPAAGEYAFFCSTPGHSEDMHGILHVTAS